MREAHLSVRLFGLDPCQLAWQMNEFVKLKRCDPRAPSLPRSAPFLVRRLQVLQKPIVVSVCTDPEPNHRVAIEHAYGAVADSDACRICGRIVTDLLEVQPRVTRILPKKPIGFPSLTLDVGWQRSEQLSKAPRRARIHKSSGSNS